MLGYVGSGPYVLSLVPVEFAKKIRHVDKVALSYTIPIPFILSVPEKGDDEINKIII